jgi:hypothetical protein
MRSYILSFFTFLLFSITIDSNAQSFNDESDVMMYMEGKTFYSSESGLNISYGYISSMNTAGIKIVNKFGVSFFYINVDITSYGSFADLYGMSPEDGSNFGFRLYPGRIVIGKGEPGEKTYYLK